MSVHLENRGITVFDPDSRGGNGTARLQPSAGTIVVSAGTTGVAVSGTTSNVLLTGSMKALDNLFRGNLSATIVYTNATPGSGTITITVTDEDGLASVGSLSFVAANYVPPVVTQPGGSPTATQNATNNIHGAGFSVADSDDSGGYATMQLYSTSGTISVSSGNAGITVLSGNGVGTSGTPVIVTGKISKLSGLLTAAGTGTILWTPAALGSQTFTVIVTDSQGQVSVATGKAFTVGAAPVVVSPATFLPGTVLSDINIHGAGFSVTDADASGTTNLCSLSASLPITAVAGTSGVTSISGNGTGLVTFQGTIAAINNLLTSAGGAAGTIKATVGVAGTFPFTVTVTDIGSRVSNVGSVNLVFATGTVWTGFAQAQLPATTVTVAGFVAPIDLQNMPASWWSTVSPDGRDIRVVTWDGATETQVPCDIDPLTFNYTTHKGMVYAKIQNSATPPAVRVYCGASNATLPARASTYGRDNTYDTSIIKAWWPAGAGVDRSVNANDLTSTGSVATATLPVSGSGSSYALTAYAKAIAAVEDNIPEQFACFQNGTSVGSDRTLVSSCHGTIRNYLGYTGSKARAKTDIQGGSAKSAFATGTLPGSTWQLIAAEFYSTTSRLVTRDGGNLGNDTGTAAGAAGGDAYIISGIGTDVAGTVGVAAAGGGPIGLAFITKYAAVDASKFRAWVANYKNAYSQVTYWGTWAWTGSLSVTGL